MGERFPGIPVSPGVATGRAWVHAPATAPVVPEPVPPERLEEEVRRFDSARRAAAGQLEELRRRAQTHLGRGCAAILEAQRLILEDPGLAEETVRRIRVGRVSAAWALKQTVEEILRRLSGVEDGFFRERGGDVQEVHRRLQRLLRGGPTVVDAPGDEPRVVVAHSLGPGELLGFATGNVVGVATDTGSRTSHIGILAQALGLPAVLGLGDLSARVQAGEWLIVDAEQGHVVCCPSTEERQQAERRRHAWLDAAGRAASLPDGPVRTRDGEAVVLRANVELTAELARARRAGACGIGLYRSEFLFLSRAPRLPTEDEHYETYVELARAMAPHPVVIRTLDLGGERYFHDVLDREAENNPILGLRGVRLWLQRSDIALPQLRGLLRAAAEPGLRIEILLPMVSHPHEVREVKRMVAREWARLPGGPPPRVGAMIEVPAAALCADLLAREADFFSIGTNDLVQYALAVDRRAAGLAQLADPRHPAVLRLIARTVEAAQRQGIPVALCGEAATDPRMLPLFVGLGVREFSLPPWALARARSLLQAMDTREEAARAREALEGEFVPDPAG